MPGDRRNRRRNSRHQTREESSDDEVIGSRPQSRRAAKKPSRSSSDDDGGRLVSPRIRDAAKKSHFRRKDEGNGDEKPSSTRSARRERRKSRRGSRKGAHEGKSLDSVDASERDARQRRREQRRNKRTPKHNGVRRGFMSSSSPPETERAGFSSSGGGASEITEVEVIAWQHRINQNDGPSDSDRDSQDEPQDFDARSSDDDARPRPHPVAKNTWGSRQPVPADSDSTAGLKAPRVSKRRELSPVNVRRRAQEKILEKKRLSKKNLLASDSDDGDNEQPAPRSRRARGNRAGRRAKPQESESSESSESDDEPTGRRRRGGNRRGRNKQLQIKKPLKTSESKDTEEPNTPGTPSEMPADATSGKTLHRTSHEKQLIEQDTPSGHKKLVRTSPKNATPTTQSPALRAKLKAQLQADGLGREASESKVESLVAHRKRLLRALETGEAPRAVPVFIPERSRPRVKGSAIQNILASPSSASPTRLAGLASSIRRRRKSDHNAGGEYSDDSESKSSSPRHGVNFTSGASRDDTEPDVTPGDKGRAVFKGAFSGSPTKTLARADYSLAENANWVQRKNFLTSPVPANAGIQQCTVVRTKKKDCFVLWLEQSRPGEKKKVEFLMVGKQRKGAKATLNYVISMDESDHSRHGKGCIGKLRANMRTTEYTLFDQGLNPTLAGNRRKAASPNNQNQLREELCLIEFVKGSMGFARGPREITAFLPFVNRKTLETLRCRPVREEDGLKSWVMQHRDDARNLKTFKLINKPPVWNEQVRKYILNFNGRVEVASVKNFQLVLTQDPETLVLQCGRSHDSEDGSSTFILDFGWPLSPIQAFSIGLAGMTA